MSISNQQKQIRYKSLPTIICGVMTYSLGSVYFGYSMGYFNAIEYKHLHQIFSIQMRESTAQGLISGCIPLGALLGAYSSKSIMAKTSRKQSFMLADLLSLIAGLLLIIGWQSTLLMGRLLQGFCVGLFSALVPLMLKEYTPIQLFGRLGALPIPSIGIGFLFAYILPYYLNRHYQVEQYWRWTFFLSSILMQIQLFLLWKMYRNQTPKYLIAQNKISQAKQFIKDMYKQQFINQIINQKITNNFHKTTNLNTIINQNNQLYSLDITPSELKAIQIENAQKIIHLQEQSHPTISIPQLQTQIYPKDIPIAKLFAFLLQTLHQLSGINVIVIYGSHLAESSIPHLKQEVPIIINGIKIVAGIAGSVLLGKYGRRRPMLIGNSIIFFSLISLSICFSLPAKTPYLNYLVLTFLLLFICTFVMSLGPITWMYIPQIVQPPTVPYTTMTNWAFAWLIITIFPMAKQHLTILFLIFSICTLINILMCYILMVETKDKGETQIIQEITQVQNKADRLITMILA